MNISHLEFRVPDSSGLRHRWRGVPKECQSCAIFPQVPRCCGKSWASFDGRTARGSAFVDRRFRTVSLLIWGCHRWLDTKAVGEHVTHQRTLISWRRGGAIFPFLWPDRKQLVRKAVRWHYSRTGDFLCFWPWTYTAACFRCMGDVYGKRMQTRTP